MKRTLIKRVLGIFLVAAMATAIMPAVTWTKAGDAHSLASAERAGEKLHNQTQNTGDDGVANWNFITPVTHQKTVPDGYVGIYTAEQLATVNNDNNYILMNDIDLASWGEWTPVNEFGGGVNDRVFDGNGYVIKNMKISSQHEQSGLFTCVGENAQVKNLGVVESEIILDGNDDEENGYFAGTIAGTLRQGSIFNCFSTGSVSVGEGAYWYCVGGIAGWIDKNGSIVNCYNTGSVTSAGVTSAAGIVGFADSHNAKIDNCYNEGNITGGKYVAGILGRTFSDDMERTRYVDIAHCYNIGNITANDSNGDSFAGGVGGILRGVTLKNCYNEGKIKAVAEREDGEAYAQAAGIAASVSAVKDDVNREPLISDCYNTGVIEAQATFMPRAAGIAGWAGEGAAVVDSYNTGSVTSVLTCNSILNGCAQAGGVVALAVNADVLGCYNLGSVFGIRDAADDSWCAVGGIVGMALSGSVIARCYNEGDVAGSDTEQSQLSAGCLEVGGIAGEASGTDISDVYNIGKISVDATSILYAMGGGIVGASYGDISITKGYNTADISAENTATDALVYAGGIIGAIYSETSSFIDICRNTGNVETKSISSINFTGGLAGIIRSTSMANCYSMGDVTAIVSPPDIEGALAWSGGLVGCISYESIVSKCYAAGNVKSIASTPVDDETLYCGGVAGFAEGCFVDHCYYLDSVAKGIGDDDSYDVSIVYLIALTDALMKQQKSYEDFDFDTIWGIDDGTNNGYPYLVALQSENDHEIGDANGDGVVNTGDAAVILQYVVGGAELDEAKKKAADFNRDGLVNTGDAAAILKWIVEN